MNERIKRLEEKIEKDIKRRDALNESIRENQAKLKELQQTDLLNQVTILMDDGADMDRMLQAIREKDLDTLMTLMDEMPSAAPKRERKDADE